MKLKSRQEIKGCTKKPFVNIKLTNGKTIHKRGFLPKNGISVVGVCLDPKTFEKNHSLTVYECLVSDYCASNPLIFTHHSLIKRLRLVYFKTSFMNGITRRKSDVNEWFFSIIIIIIYNNVIIDNCRSYLYIFLPIVNESLTSSQQKDGSLSKTKHSLTVYEWFKKENIL